MGNKIHLDNIRDNFAQKVGKKISDENAYN